jgi:cation diffusion facilitator CzcD-associated flavoprotein CzcO
MSYQQRRCIIVGAGASGLVQAAEILRKNVLTHGELQILERAHDFGGVWSAATYVCLNIAVATSTD